LVVKEMNEEIYRLKIIHTTYHTKDDKPVVEIYGRTERGKSATVMFDQYWPYCYMEKNEEALKVLKDSAKISPLILWDEIGEITLEHKREMVACYKITTKHPGALRKIRDRIDYWYHNQADQNLSELPEFFSADIAFGLQFMYDLDLGSCIEVLGTPREDNGRYTTDLVIDADIVSDTEDFQADYCQMSFDIESSLYPPKDVLCICVTIQRPDGEIREHRLVGEEKSILKQFEKVIQEEDPDIITGYNINNFDIPRINDRCESNFLSKIRAGRNSTSWRPKEVKNGTIWLATGRIVADAWQYIRKLKNYPREKLNYVAKRLLGKEKLDVDAKDIDNEWRADRSKVLEYCQIDSDLALEILNELKVVNSYSDLASVAKLPLYTVFEGHSSRLIDSFVIREADRRGFAVPTSKRYDPKAGKNVEGATVLEYTKGIHKWVIVLDYKSLYPTTMMAHNLCFTTFDPEEGTTESPIGARFLDESIRRGIIPDMLIELLAQRSKYKKLRKGDLYDYYHGLQEAVKVVMNSVYGLLTGKFYRFTNPAIGGSVTAYGRKALNSVADWLRNHGYEIIFGDTDSVGILVPGKNLESAIKLGTEIASQFSHDKYELEFEKVLDVFFTHGKKKRYYSRAVWADGKTLDKPEEYVRGYEVRRTDSFEFGTTSLQRLFEIITDQDPQLGPKYALEQIEKLRKGIVPPEQIAIAKSCKPLREYVDADKMPQVRAMKEMMEMGYPFTPYMKVAYIVINSKAKPQLVKPFIDGQPFTYTPDWEYYMKRTAEMLGRVTEVVGWESNDLILGNRQSTMDAFMG